jgi:primosomal protein N' (replication factor Y)
MHLLIKAPSAADIRRSLSVLPEDLEIRINIDPQ